MQTICEKERCTGCAACMNSCPAGCITMVEDTIGHLFPRIAANRCMDCGKCVRACPGLQPVALHKPNHAFAAWSLDEEEHTRSTSGGIASLLTRKTLEAGGTVYGCSSRLTAEGVRHIRVDRQEEAWQLRGSKYIQSQIGDSYTQIKAELEDDCPVLFIGTPCQVGGLRSFLGREYEKLLTVDLICHGTPPQRLLYDDIGIQPAQLEGKLLSFREPEGYLLKILSSQNSPLFSAQERDDLFYIGFSKNLFFRKSCYQCPYARTERVGDLTIGDFWGLGAKQPFAHRTKNGVSVVLPNTKKGEQAFSSVREALFCEERPVEEAVLGNWNLMQPSLPHKKTELFLKLYPQLGFQKAAKSCLKKDIFRYHLLKQLQKMPVLLRLVSWLKSFLKG